MIKRIAAVALAGALALSVAGAMPAAAKDGDVIKRGSCSGSADWKLKLSPEDGRIEVEYEVDSNVNGQTWKVKLFKNGDRIFRGTRTTKAPSGSFEVRVVTSDPAGTDTIRGKAVNVATGEACRGTASF
ncbi:MAG TPA: hypothetical protein VFT80_14815 [Actinomycetota bacterium]|nr:hypothetical protein [Actinomycetota bacterium]